MLLGLLIRMTWNSKLREKTQGDKTLVFQNNKYKMQIYINPFEQNNDHTWAMHKIQFHSFFKVACGVWLTWVLFILWLN